MKRKFVISSLILFATVILAGCNEEPKTASAVAFDSVSLAEAGDMEGITRATCTFTMPESREDFDGYDKLLVSIPALDSPVRFELNGVCIATRGFFGEPWNGKRDYNLYIPTDTDCLNFGSANTLDIYYTSGTEANIPACLTPVKSSLPETITPDVRYYQMMQKFRKGWNTWDTRSVFTQVYLPEGFAVKVALADGKGETCRDLRIGNRRSDAATVHPYGHTYDGTYSEVDADWHGISVKLRTAAKGEDLIMLISPKEGNAPGGMIEIKPEAAWNMLSSVAGEGGESFEYREDGRFMFHRADWSVSVDGHIVADGLKYDSGTYLCSSSSPILIYVGKKYSVKEAEQLLDSLEKDITAKDKEKYGEKYEAYHSMQSILAWDTIFDPGDEVVVTPVSRNWNGGHATVRDFGGYVIYDWDTFFASQMLSTGCKELAYSNVAEVTASAEKLGFVPKSREDHNSMTEDQSQPPVGSMSVWKIYERYGEKWFLELVYDRLLAWNRWWPQARQTDGLLCWGSNQIRIRKGERQTGSKHNAILESGLDNSAMYDDSRYDPVTCQLNIQDVGLTSMYVMDCNYLEKIARELGHYKDAREIGRRGDFFRKNLDRCWCEEDGMFYNINADTGEFNKRMSPTLFYVFLANAATDRQAERMINEHLLNEEEFWGEWVIPNTPRNDPAFNDQSYWRGRIWGPTNFLVYSGLVNYADKELLHEFARKGEKLIMQGWLKYGYIYENWNAITGEGGDKSNCDSFYHWGALLSYIALLDNGLK